MSHYRRNYVESGTYFFTVVTYRRRPFLTSDLGRNCLRDAIDTVKKKRPFEIVAIVLLPDHLHAVWTLPTGDAKLVSRVGDWSYSSFHRFVAAGQYDSDWGGVDPTPGYDTPEWVVSEADLTDEETD